MKYKSLNLLNWQWVTVAISLVLSTILFLVVRSSASAATINVVAGTDAINDNNQCQLSEAIQNINDQAQTNNDCPAGNGNNDTINLPVGTVTLSADSYLENSVNDTYSFALGNVDRVVAAEASFVINGAGVSQSIVSGAGEYLVGATGANSVASFRNFSIKNTNVATLMSYNVQALNVDNVLMDGLGDCLTFGIFLGGNTSADDDIAISNVEISNIACTQEGVPVLALNMGKTGTGKTNLLVENVSIRNLTSADSIVGINLGGALDANIRNTTISGLSGELAVTGVAAQILNQTSDNIIADVSYNNVTVSDTESPLENYQPPGFPVAVEAGAITSSVGSLGAGSTTLNVELQNTVLSDSQQGDLLRACSEQNLNELADIPGETDVTITSLGGNISDDESCNDYFTQETDKNNITNLGDFLGDIANNGGSIPTIALLPGNPAIDGGVCGEGVPETDVRGISRPQGKTCDSGAYEVEQAAPAGTVSGGKAVAVNVPAGVVVNEFGTVSGSIPTDNQGDAEYEFPLGLLSFELGVPEGSANEISLDFESDLDPSSVVARKYNPSDQSFTTLTNATITKITKDNKPTLRLTYQITDGTFPDLDNQANGTITDPIGLATEKKGVLANTGIIVLVSPLGIIIASLAIATYLDYRRHKKPLMDADPFNASTYTYWHHLRTVTIPLFSYRLSFAFERKRSAGL